jgi:transposase
MEGKMTLKEANRLAVMKQIERKKMNLKKAAEELDLSYKQVLRVHNRYLQEGANGLISRHRGQPSNNRLPSEVVKKALYFIRKKYGDYGPTLAKEKLEEKHKLFLSKETVRQLMIKEGIWHEKKHVNKKTHPRRTRRSRIGELEQIDGSYEYWFEKRGEKCCLLVCVDDATSAIMRLKFCRTETTEDYIDFVKSYIKCYGRPLAFYSDKHGIFRVNNKQKYEGSFTTRFHEVLKNLDIELICANSPQAKGRVERANGVLQDRLIKELRERNINDIDKANEFLEEFIIKYNNKFAIEPAIKKDAHRKLRLDQDLDKICRLRTERTLSKDLSFQYKNEIYQVNSLNRNRLHCKKVEVVEIGEEVKIILSDGREIECKKWREKIAEPTTKIVDSKELEILWPTVNKKPRRNHPWR